MRRRTFLQLSGLGTLGAMAGCAEARTLVTDAGPPETDARAAAAEAGAPPPDAYVPGDVGTAPFVVTAMSVVLNDPSCSGHDHGFGVEATTYTDDTPIEFLDGSHLVAFRPSELVRMARGEQLPFATIGPGPGHGHCGLAWLDGLYPRVRDRVDACTTMSPPDAPPAICERRPSA